MLSYDIYYVILSYAMMLCYAMLFWCFLSHNSQIKYVSVFRRVKLITVIFLYPSIEKNVNKFHYCFLFSVAGLPNVNSAVVLGVLLPITIILIIVVICLTWRLRKIPRPQAGEVQRESNTDQPRVYMELQPKETYQSLDRTTGLPPTGGAPDRGPHVAYENVGIYESVQESKS